MLKRHPLEWNTLDAKNGNIFKGERLTNMEFCVVVNGLQK